MQKKRDYTLVVVLLPFLIVSIFEWQCTYQSRKSGDNALNNHNDNCQYEQGECPEPLCSHADSITASQPGSGPVHLCPYKECPYHYIPVAKRREAILNSGVPDLSDNYSFDNAHFLYPQMDYDQLDSILSLKTLPDGR